MITIHSGVYPYRSILNMGRLDHDAILGCSSVTCTAMCTHCYTNVKFEFVPVRRFPSRCTWYCTTCHAPACDVLGLLKPSSLNGISLSHVLCQHIDHRLLSSQGYSVAFDPLDGSSIIDTNFAVGTIFGVWPGNRLVGISGRELAASGMAVYGPRTTMTVAGTFCFRWFVALP